MDDNVTDDGTQHLHNQLQREGPRSPVVRRNYVGWVLLGLMLLAMFGLNLKDYLTRKPSSASTFSTIDFDIKAKMPQPDAKTDDEFWSDIDRRLRSASQPRASRYRVAISIYRGKAISESDLNTLRSQKPADPIVRIAMQTDTKERLASAEGLKGKEVSHKLVLAAAREASGIPSSGPESLLNPKTMALGMLVIGGLCLGVVGLVFWVMIVSGNPPWFLSHRGHPAEPLTLPEADAFTIRGAQLFACMMILPGIFIFAVPPGLPIAVRGVIASLLGVVFALILPIFRANGVSIPWAKIGLTKDNLGMNLLSGVAGLCMNIPVLIGTAMITGQLNKVLPQAEHPASAQLMETQSVVTIICLFIMASVVAPLTEELLFRGLILPAIGRIWATIGAFAVTNLIFAAIHPTGIPAWPVLMGVGITSSVLAYRTNSIVPSIVMHALHNGAALTLILLLAKTL